MTQLEQLNAHLATCEELTRRYGSRASLDRALARGVYRRVARGVYLHRHTWESLNAEEAYLTRILALNRLHQGLIFSHHTAALLHGLPSPIDTVPDAVHIYSYQRIRSRGCAVHHGELHLPTETTVLLPGLRITSLERTLTDLAENPQASRFRIKL